METIFFFWLVIALLFLILEMGHPGLFFFLSFFFGALFSAVASYFSDSLIVQGVVFLVGSACSLIFLRYWLRAHLFLTKKEHHTNVYALQGKTGIVLREITQHKPGQVKVGGETWSAKPGNAETIQVGSIIRVVTVSGSHVIVEKLVQK